MTSRKNKALILSQKNIYLRLVGNLKKEIEQGLGAIARYAEARKVLTYWKLGRLIRRFLTNNSSFRNQDIYLKLSEDLHVNERTLQQCVQFERVYPKLESKLSLSWSHYRHLMTLEKKERQAWQKRILKENLNAEQFIILLRQAKAKPLLLPLNASKQKVKRGTLYAYRLMKVDYALDSPGGLVVDCGFEIRIQPPPAHGKLDNKRIVESVKDKDGLYTLKLSHCLLEDIFTYKALIERVVDGDTLIVNIDAGFGIWKRERLRLRGIDAPEARTIAGDKAKYWLENEIAGLPFVIIKTYKTDKYDRYLVDVFYEPRMSDPSQVAETGSYLNGLMLSRGLAKAWVL
ncbi:MAG: thermonuclease family protein [Candidatus Omnitrophota bacterium]